MRVRGRRAQAARSACLIAALLTAAGAAAAEQAPAAPMVEQFLRRLSAAAGMRARFTQINHWAVIEEADTSRGVLTVAPPERFRLEYEVPRGHRVGCDGRHVWTYVPEERQVLRARVAATTGWGDFFLRAFYEGADSLVAITTGPGGRRVASLTLGPRPEWGVRAMEIALDADRCVPLAYGYTDEEGNRYRFDFEGVEFPVTLEEGLLQFTVPPGYELVELD